MTVGRLRYFNALQGNGIRDNLTLEKRQIEKMLFLQSRIRHNVLEIDGSVLFIFSLFQVMVTTF